MERKTRTRKTISAAIAIVCAIAITLTGTFAWQSISQTALNETAGEANPGGRLHDDFNGTNKDIYVENFTNPDDGGMPIYVRVRLDEYMEIGAEAGMKAADGSFDENRSADSVIAGAKINDVSTWKTHIPGDSTDEFHTYWDWAMGGSTVFMPTFNKNKDSLSADINGTYEGLTEGDDVHYDDYQVYTAGQTVTDDEVYDFDNNDIDEGDNAVDGVNIKTVANVTHTARETLTGTVMTMAEWIAAGSHPGPYWVYDTDGWAYWAQALEPGEATGLLLDGIEMTNKPGDNWYYAINVVGQFATAGDFGEPGEEGQPGTGFYNTDNGAPLSDDAKALLEAAVADLGMEKVREEIAAITPGSTETVAVDGYEWYVLVNDTENHRVLLWAKNTIMEYDGNLENEINWSECSLRTWLNQEFLNTLSILNTSNSVIESPISTRLYCSDDHEITEDCVFLLSESDLFGTAGNPTNDEKDYTYGNSQLVSNIELRKSPNPSWLRTKGDYALNAWQGLSADGTEILYATSSQEILLHGIRPALWVYMGN